MTDLVGSQVDMMFAPVVNSLPLANAGKLQALAVTSAKRSVLAPELPTVAESGLPGFEVTGWYGLAAPAATPPAVIAKLNADQTALQSAGVIAELRQRASSPSAVHRTEAATAIPLRSRRRKLPSSAIPWTSARLP
jgi:tripartite-type tricarboxylate transporter receptor subunit TctC